MAKRKQDNDARWMDADVSGDEPVGGTAPTPGQDVVDEPGHTLGINYEADEPLATADLLNERDENRFELSPASMERDPDEDDEDNFLIDLDDDLDTDLEEDLSEVDEEEFEEDLDDEFAAEVTAELDPGLDVDEEDEEDDAYNLEDLDDELDDLDDFLDEDDLDDDED